MGLANALYLKEIHHMQNTTINAITSKEVKRPHVALSGKICSGKDTAARILSDVFKEYNPNTFKFADRLYQLCANLDGVADWDHNGWLAPLVTPTTSFQYDIAAKFIYEMQAEGLCSKELNHEAAHGLMKIALATPTAPGVKNRARLQAVGEFMRHVCPGIWTNTLARVASLHIGSVIISDLRTLEEAEWCREQGILRLRLDVSSGVQLDRMSILGMDRTLRDHPNESALDNYIGFSTRIPNNDDAIVLRERLVIWATRTGLITNRVYSEDTHEEFHALRG